MDVHRPAIDPAQDNRAAIQAAIDAVHDAGGGTVELAGGDCPLAAPLELRSNVTLRGAGMIATVLRATTEGAAVRSSSLLAGATIEELTIAGPAAAGTSAGELVAGGAAAIDLAAGASFCFLRRIRFTELVGGAVRIGGGPVDHLYLENLAIEGCGGDGIVLDPTGDADGVFLTEVSVRSFGRAAPAGAAGVRTSCRAFISQLHVQPVERGATGLALEPGSEHTVASNLFFGLAGGDARSSGRGAPAATIEAELIRDLLDGRLARTFP